jgi:hypothetical protein
MAEGDYLEIALQAVFPSGHLSPNRRCPSGRAVGFTTMALSDLDRLYLSPATASGFPSHRVKPRFSAIRATGAWDPSASGGGSDRFEGGRACVAVCAFERYLWSDSTALRGPCVVRNNMFLGEVRRASGQ